MKTRGMPRWPVLLIASPAAVAVWSGWVALGAMCGFGPVNLLPGIGHGYTLNTAITLPVGVEAYGAYALGAWLLPGTPERARRFAGRSAAGSLLLGAGGQVIYHLLAAAHLRTAPWPVTVFVSCLPVVALGFGATLAHLLAAGEEPGSCPYPRPAPVMELAPESLRDAAAGEPVVASAGIARSGSAAPGVTAPELARGALPRVPVANSGSAPRSASAKRRAVPVKASDEELAELVLPLFGGPDEVRKYRIIKAVKEARGIGIGDERAGRILDLARSKHRAQRVVPIKTRR